VLSVEDALPSTDQSTVEVLNATTVPASTASTGSKFSARSAAASISNPVARTRPETRSFSSPNCVASLPIPTVPLDAIVSAFAGALVIFNLLRILNQ
jgi:hypothetical protein